MTRIIRKVGQAIRGRANWCVEIMENLLKDCNVHWHKECFILVN